MFQSPKCLCSKKGCLPEEEARRFFQQLVIGLEYCHKMGVVNRYAPTAADLGTGCLETGRVGWWRGSPPQCSARVAAPQASVTVCDSLACHTSVTLLVALEGLQHTLPVLHRDIKLENALLDGDARLLKLTDFGYAKTEVDSLPISQVGTPNYAGLSAWSCPPLRCSLSSCCLLSRRTCQQAQPLPVSVLVCAALQLLSWVSTQPGCSRHGHRPRASLCARMCA